MCLLLLLKEKITTALCLSCIYTHGLSWQGQEISPQLLIRLHKPETVWKLQLLETNLILALSLIRVSSFLDFSKSHTSGGWFRGGCASKYWLPTFTTKADYWDFQQDIESMVPGLHRADTIPTMLNSINTQPYSLSCKRGFFGKRQQWALEPIWRKGQTKRLDCISN